MKIRIKQLSSIRSDYRDKKIVFLAGTFDLLHVGHLTYLKKAVQFGDIVIVGINSDARTKHTKGDGRPVINQAHRVSMVASLKAVDYAFVMPKTSSTGLRPTLQIVKLLRPDVFLVADRGWLASVDYCKKHGTELVLLPRIDRTSTSRIIKKIQSDIK